MGKTWTVTCQQKAWRGNCRSRLFVTLGDALLGTPDLVGLLGEQLVTLFADLDDLLAGDAEVLDCGENLLGDLSGGLVLGQGVGVVERVIWEDGSAVAQRLRCWLT